MNLIGRHRRDSDERIAILGAGNTNELDVDRLLEWFASVHLVDLDKESLHHAQRRFEGSPKCQIHSPVDLSGVLGQLQQMADDAQHGSDQVVDSLIQTIDAASVQIESAPFSMVVSACLLTQLFDSVEMVLGREHPRLADVVLAMRRSHVQLMTRTLAPGGCGLLVTDFLSTTTYPALMEIPDGDFPAAMSQAVIDRNFFTGANPIAIQHQLRQTPEIATDEPIELFGPWRWNLGPRQFAVAALSFRRTKTDIESPTS